MRIYDPCWRWCVFAHHHRLSLSKAGGTSHRHRPGPPGFGDSGEEPLPAFPEGLERRRRELESYAAAFGKDSHRAALESLERLRDRLGRRSIAFSCGQRDITDLSPFPVQDVDIIITDLPYGQLASWGGEGGDPLESLFINCRRALKEGPAVLAIVADKKPRLKHEAFRRVDHFKLGKRQIALLQPL